MPIRPDVIKDLERIVGPNHVLVDIEDLYVYSFEKIFNKQTLLPCAVIRTRSAEEEAKVMELSRIKGFAVISRGEKVDVTIIEKAKDNGIIVLDNSSPSEHMRILRGEAKMPVDKNWILKLLSGLRDRLLYKCQECSLCKGYCPIGQTVYEDIETWSSKGRYLISRAMWSDEISCTKKVLDILYSCATCGMCFASCDLNLNKLFEVFTKARSRIVEKGTVSPTIRDALENTKKYWNPWGMHPSKRSYWLEELNFRVPVLKEGRSIEMLLYVGCAIYDRRVKEAAKSLAKILIEHLNLNVGILANEEKCCGNNQRRMGEEGLFEILVDENSRVFSSIDFNNVVTLCPHCYSTFKNEYPEFGIEVNPIHYTEFLEKRLCEIEFQKFSGGEKKRVTYHDPCYLERHNNIQEPPRKLLRRLPGFEFVEIESGMQCCGGGGGRMWFDDPFRKIPPAKPVLEGALAIGADVIAVACPFCLISFEDAAKVLGIENKLMVKDISELICSSLDDT